MSGFPPSFIPALWNIGILHHKKAKLRKHMRQSVVSKQSGFFFLNFVTFSDYLSLTITFLGNKGNSFKILIQTFVTYFILFLSLLPFLLSLEFEKKTNSVSFYIYSSRQMAVLRPGLVLYKNRL